MTRPNYSAPSFFTLFPAVFFGLALSALSGLATPSAGQAQVVLESGGVVNRGPSVIEIRASNGDILPVEEVTGRAEATGAAYGVRGFVQVRTNAVVTENVCETPCRFQLNRPMELRVDDQRLNLMPGADTQRYRLDPTNRAGRGFGLVSIITGSATLGVGGAFVGIYHAFKDDQYEPAPLALRNVGIGFAVAGGVLLIVGVIARVASRGRIERVDGFDF